LAGLEHLADDVAAADELALDVELRDGRPLAEVLDALAQLRVDQDVDAVELHAELAQHVDDGGREPALREHRRALHEQEHLVLAELVADALEHLGFAHINLLEAPEWVRACGKYRALTAVAPWWSTSAHAKRPPCDHRARRRPSGVAGPWICRRRPGKSPWRHSGRRRRPGPRLRPPPPECLA